MLAACGGPGTSPAIRLGDLPLPCEQQGYPCTWNEVDPAITTRTQLLATIAARYSLTAPSLDSIATLLRVLPGMAEVSIDGSGVRFRLDGGRPAWVFLPGEMDHHRMPEGAVPPQIGLGTPAPETTRLGALGSGVGRLLRPTPLLAATLQEGERIAGEPGEPKKALVISPFDYEWPAEGFPSLGADFTRRILKIKDYKQENGGEVTYHADLSRLSDNPADPGSRQRTAEGTLLLSGEVQFEDFLGWDKRKLNLIILASHGTTVNCYRGAPRGGDPAIVTEKLPPWTEGQWCPSIYVGRAKQETYGQYRGVEIYMAADYSWTRPPDPVTKFDQPGEVGWRDVRPELSETEARECAELVARKVKDPATSSGAPCDDQKWEHDYNYLILWWPFFLEQYPNGLEKVIVFLGACYSGVNMVLPDILAKDGNEAVTVFAFDKSVVAGDAWHVIGSMLHLVDRGYHSKELIRRLKELDRTQHLVGKTMDPSGHEPSSRPPEILDKGAHATHGRDVVQLVDPATGEEITDSAMVTVRGSPGDRKPDLLELRARIIGVASDDPIDQVRLFVSPEDDPQGSPYLPEKRVREGVYEHDGDLSLGRDHREGEHVDLEIRAELPDGGESRWVYRDIRLGGSWWDMRLSGVRSGRFGGSRATARAGPEGIVGINLLSDAAAPSNLIAITFGARSPLTAPGAVTPAGGVSLGLDLDRMADGGADGFCTGRGGPAYAPPPTVTIGSISDRYVKGSVTGVLHRCDPGHKPAERSSVQIDFVAAVICRPGTTGGPPCRN